MATLSADLGALAEKIAADMEAHRSITIGPIYAALIRMRDEAVVLEARAGERDVQVHGLVATLSAECDRFARLTTEPQGAMQ